MDADGLLADLTPDQRAAVVSEAAPLCVMAPAGSGKTRVLTRRLAHRVVTGSANPLRSLAVTFTRQAAAELRERLSALGVRDQVAAATIHAAALAQLRLWWLHHDRRPLTVIDDPARVLRRTLKGDLAAAAPAIAREVSWAKARLLTPRSYARAAAEAGRGLPLALTELAEAWEAYEQHNLRAGTIDLDDLVVRCADAFEADAGFAAAQRWRFRHLFVDEAQDLTPAQWRLVRAWLGPGTDLCLVGDPHQAIYGWSGADAGSFADVHRAVPGATVVHLVHNHRCAPEVVAAAAAVLAHPPAVVPARPPGGAVHLSGSASPELEAEACADEVAAALADGRRPADLAVLARSHDRLDLIEEACAARRIPVARARRARWRNRPGVAAALADLVEAPPGLDLAGAASRLRSDASEVGLQGVAEVVDLVHEYLALEPRGDAAGFESWLAASEPPPPGGGVSLTTFHAAKGREWSCVWVMGLEGTSADPEERRLLHVAFTRAADHLHVSWVGSPTALADRLAMAADQGAGTHTDWRRELATVRAKLAARSEACRAGPPGPLRSSRRAQR